MGSGQQEPIFSQYMFNTQSINPAYAGMWEKIGFIALVRKQFSGFDKSPLTEMISFHSPVYKQPMGIGLNVIHDRFVLEDKFSVFADYSYELLVSSKSQLRLGLTAGFTNYQNALRSYELNEYPDPVYLNDYAIRFMPNFGVGVFWYNESAYAGLSIPRLIPNNLPADYIQFSPLLDTRYIYLKTGYIFRLNENLLFKPSIMFRISMMNTSQIDLGINFMVKEKLWLGTMLRTGDALCFVSQWIFNNNIRIGYAIDITFSDIYRYQKGTHEFTISYDVDLYGRHFVRSRYF
jgi:type IX secretion system PorP/SprF family membrane protein